MSNDCFRVKPITYKLNCSEECQKVLRPYFQVYTGLFSQGTSIPKEGGTEGEHRAESIHFRPGEKQIIDVVLRDQVTQELIGRTSIHLDQVKEKKGVFTEWYDLIDLVGISVGKIMLELEWKHLDQIQRQPTEQLEELVDVEELIEDLRDSLGEMMLETNLMFNDISKRFFPEFTSNFLGFLDTPLWIQYQNRGRKPRRHRARKAELKHKGPEGLYKEKFPEIPTKKEGLKTEGEFIKEGKRPEELSGTYKGSEETAPERSQKSQVTQQPVTEKS